MKNLIEEDPVAERISAMDWWTLDQTHEEEHFLTSDSPVVINGGNSLEPVTCISLALSPSRLLAITKRHKDIDEDFVRTLAAAHNFQMCKQANTLLISSRRLGKGRYTNFLGAAESLFLGKITSVSKDKRCGSD
jgi:hypothetical protein